MRPALPSNRDIDKDIEAFAANQNLTREKRRRSSATEDAEEPGMGT